MNQRNGWGRPLNANKWHYFDNDMISLCRKWMYNGETEQGQDEHAENCVACKRKKLANDKKKTIKQS